jgi:hypothetical protein
VSESTRPISTSPPIGSHRDFGIAIFLVILTMAAGFVGFKPDSIAKMILAIVVTTHISVAFCLRQGWARPAAMFVISLGILVAVFGGILTVNDAITPTDTEKTGAWLQLLLGVLTLKWLQKSSVKAWFPPPSPGHSRIK